MGFGETRPEAAGKEGFKTLKNRFLVIFGFGNRQKPDDQSPESRRHDISAMTNALGSCARD
jgi:hypothetical protein